MLRHPNPTCNPLGNVDLGPSPGCKGFTQPHPDALSPMGNQHSPRHAASATRLGPPPLALVISSGARSEHQARTVCFGAAVGTATRSTAGRRPATASTRPTGTTSWVSVPSSPQVSELNSGCGMAVKGAVDDNVAFAHKGQSSLWPLPGLAAKGPPCRASCALGIPGPVIPSCTVGISARISSGTTKTARSFCPRWGEARAVSDLLNEPPGSQPQRRSCCRCVNSEN